MGNLIMMPRKPQRGDFVVSLKSRNGEFCLFVVSFIKANGKSYLKHTTDVSEAQRFSRAAAEEAVQRVKEHRCTGRVEPAG